MKTEEALPMFRERFVAAGLPQEVQSAFEDLYRVYRAGETGVIPWEETSPIESQDIVPLETLEQSGARAEARENLGALVWIVLNGGLGTSMQMRRAKSLIEVKGKLTFLDLIARHALGFRSRFGRDVPLLFMNSFATREDTLRKLKPYPLRTPEHGTLSLDFEQNRFPRICEERGTPYGDPDDREAWAPPGHGDLYLALHCSGLLEKLLARGIRWAFVSNADNLGASPHPGILGFMASRGMEFLMEVTEKTAADVKGGTLVRRRGHLELLEIAQVPADHVPEFQDVSTFPVFNTNNLWVNLEALRARLREGTLGLPLLVNRKEAGTVRVVQLETAMGAAIGAFRSSCGVLVPRNRFAPVKTTDDLLVRRSDVHIVGGRSPLVPNPARDPALGPPVVRLDPRYFRSVPDLDLRIPSPPSLLGSVRLDVEGDVRFGEGVVIIGNVEVRNEGEAPLRIPDGAVLSG
jgi:UTP--glucose-1-phosphate uridylyltransferase